jgi:hypothetical protein
MDNIARQLNPATQQPDLLARKQRMHALLAGGAPIEAVLDAIAGLHFEERKLPDAHPLPQLRRRRP